MSGSSSSSVSGDLPDILQLQKGASVFKMLLSTMVAVLPSIGAGTAMAFTSIAAPQYRIENSTSLVEPLTEDQSSWFVSIMAIAMMVGILSSGFISDKLGLKLCLIIGCAVQTLGWAMLYFAPDFLVLMSGRIITGIGSGICTPASYIILSEYALIRYRGMLSTFNTLIINITFLYSFVLGATVPFEYIIPLSSFPLLIFFVLSWKWLYESPLWSVKKSKTADAVKNLSAIRGPNYNVQPEIDELEMIVLEQEDKLTLREKLNYMTSRAVQMPLGITLILFAFQATCGADTVCYYALDIFTASKVDISPYILAIMLQSAFTVGYAISTPMLARMKRRTQFILSGSLMVAAYSVLGVCLYLKETVAEGSTSAQVFGVLSPACVMISALGYGIGFGPILYSLTGEIMPPRVKGVCCSLCFAFRNCLVFLLLKIFPSMVAACGLPVVFWFHSFICLAGTVFAFVFLPETQGKTLTELSNLFVKKPETPKMILPTSLTLSKEKEASMV